MKKYKEYMDGVKAPDTLHQRLVELEVPGKRPIPWKRYGSMAAALVLMCGLGGFAVWAAGVNSRNLPVPFYPPGVQGTEAETADEAVPDIALVEPGDVTEPGEKTLGGYDVTYGSGSEAVVAHYILPYIEYGEANGTEAASQMAVDWDIPAGASRRDLTQEEIIALMGGEDAVNTHLNWGEYELTGWGAWYEDGSFWGAYIDGILENNGWWDSPRFELAVTAGQLPPTCFSYPYSVTQEVRGLTVTADKRCYSPAISSPAGTNISDMTDLTVRFMKDDYGYCFEMSSDNSELAEETVSRLVRQIADKGLELSVVGGTIPDFVPDYDPTYEDGLVSTEPYNPLESGEICGYPLYDPDEAADPQYNVPNPDDDLCGLPLADDFPGADTTSVIPSQYHSGPPTLRVLCSEGLVDGRSGNYSWTYTEIGSNTGTSVVACGAHPLDFQDAPSLTTTDGTATLNFQDPPERVSAVCWPDSERGNTSAASQTVQVSRNGQTCALTLKDGGWIYEISAEWDGQGTASYVFYIVKN